MISSKLNSKIKKTSGKSYYFSQQKKMKILIVFFLQTVLCMQIISAQKNTPQIPQSNLEKYNYFIKKRNTNNTLGWVCLGTGLGMGVVGILDGLSNATGFNISNGTSKAKGTGLFIAGNVVALASIPFFITAHKYKRKASLALKGESVGINNRVLYNSNYTALVFKVQL